MAKERKQNIRGEITKRFFMFFTAMVMMFLMLCYYLYKIIVVDGPSLREEANQTYVKERSVEATRGNIYASDGSLLATSLPKYRLGLDPTVYGRTKRSEDLYKNNLNALCQALSNFYQDRSPDEYKEKIQSAVRNKKKYLLLNTRLLDFQERKKVLDFPLFREEKRDPTKTGVVFDKVYVRYAPFGQMAYRTIGYVKDKQKVGIENSFNTELRGTPGKGLFEKMDMNTWRPVQGGDETVPKPGYDLQTTLDVNIQDIVEIALKHGLTNYKGNYAVAIVMETATGEIKAISNMSKNPNSPTGYMETENHAITTPNDPGSVYKLVSMMAMLEEKDMNLDEVVHIGDKYFHFAGRTMSDSHAMGDAKIREIIERSSNKGVMMLMQRIFTGQNEKFYNYLKKFHLIDPINFQIKSLNPKPNFPVPAKWDKLQLLWSSVGYSSGYTPIQLLSFYNAIANNGYWVQPIIVRAAKSGSEVVIDYTQTQVRDSKPLCSPRTLAKLREMLEGVVERGTGNNIKGSLYGIAGKTGTAQRIVNGQYIKGTYYTSFIGYFPAKNPKYTMLVAMDNPQGDAESTYSRQVTAPVFKEIADNIFARDMKLHKKMKGKLPDSLNSNRLQHVLHPQDQQVLFPRLGLPKYEEDGRWVQFTLQKNQAQHLPLNTPVKTIPNVLGMSLRDALFALENRGIKVRAQGKGRVVQQSLAPGTPTAPKLLLQIQLQ